MDKVSDGSSPLTQTFSIGQDVGTSQDVEFDTLTTNTLNLGSSTTTLTDGSISGSVSITGSGNTGSLTVQGNLIVTGSITSSVLLEQVTTRSIDYSTGSNLLVMI